MIRFGPYVLVLLVLAGCATFGGMEDNLNGLVGRPEREAFKALGYPNSKQNFGNETVYVWGRSSSGTYYVPQTTSTTGYVGSTPVYGTTTYNQPVAYNYNCTIRVIVDQQNYIKTWEYDGNLGGCAAYMQRLSAYSKEQREPK